MPSGAASLRCWLVMLVGVLSSFCLDEGSTNAHSNDNKAPAPAVSTLAGAEAVGSQPAQANSLASDPAESPQALSRRQRRPRRQRRAVGVGKPVLEDVGDGAMDSPRKVILDVDTNAPEPVVGSARGEVVPRQGKSIDSSLGSHIGTAASASAPGPGPSEAVEPLKEKPKLPLKTADQPSVSETVQPEKKTMRTLGEEEKNAAAQLHQIASKQPTQAVEKDKVPPSRPLVEKDPNEGVSSSSPSGSSSSLAVASAVDSGNSDSGSAIVSDNLGTSGSNAAAPSATSSTANPVDDETMATRIPTRRTEQQQALQRRKRKTSQRSTKTPVSLIENAKEHSTTDAEKKPIQTVVDPMVGGNKSPKPKRQRPQPQPPRSLSPVGVVSADCTALSPFYKKKHPTMCKGPIRVQEKHLDPQFVKSRARIPVSEMARELRKILAEAASVQTEMGIRFILMHGTLLGSVFGGHILPWDDDLDAVLSLPDFLTLKARFEEYNNKSYNMFAITVDEQLHNVIEGRLISRYSGMYMDITVLRPSTSHDPEVTSRRSFLSQPVTDEEWLDPAITVQTKCAHKYRFSDIFPLQPTILEEVTLWGPRRPLATLVQEYGLKAFTSAVFAPFEKEQKIKDIFYCFNGTFWVPLNC